MQEELVTFFNMRKFRLKINIEVSDVQILMDKNAQISTHSEDKKIQISDFLITDFYGILFNVNFPWIDKDNTEKFIPQHVNLDQHENIMSFKKGCYPGQEIIARMKFLGKINKRMKVIENTNKEKLIENLKPQKQVSPIIKTTNNYLVQSIEKLTQ
jgi:folate-binding protein YgfZ